MYTAFGMNIDSEFALPGLRRSSASTPDLVLRWSGNGTDPGTRSVVWQSRFSDGRTVTAEVDEHGGQRLTYGEQARFDIARDAMTVQCAVDDPDDPASQRFLLDTVLWWTCLTKGRRALHGSAIQLSTGVFLFVARSGGGKTTLALELLRRGHVLFSDDVVLFDITEDGLWAQPGPPLMNVPYAAGDTSDLGSQLARFDDQEEAWVALHESAEAPAPIAGIVLLDRGDDLPLAFEPVQATVLDLLPHVWGLPHAAEDVRQRFEAVSDIVRLAPVFRLSAGTDVAPSVMAASAERGVAA